MCKFTIGSQAILYRHWGVNMIKTHAFQTVVLFIQGCILPGAVFCCVMDDPCTPDANNLDFICTAGIIVETMTHLFILFTSLVLFFFFFFKCHYQPNPLNLQPIQFNLERNKPKTMAPSAGQAYNWQLIVCVKAAVGNFSTIKQ